MNQTCQLQGTEISAEDRAKKTEQKGLIRFLVYRILVCTSLNNKKRKMFACRDKD